jgi:hypothetical protein
LRCGRNSVSDSLEGSHSGKRKPIGNGRALASGLLASDYNRARVGRRPARGIGGSIVHDDYRLHAGAQQRRNRRAHRNLLV